MAPTQTWPEFRGVVHVPCKHYLSKRNHVQTSPKGDVDITPSPTATQTKGKKTNKDSDNFSPDMKRGAGCRRHAPRRAQRRTRLSRRPQSLCPRPPIALRGIGNVGVFRRKHPKMVGFRLPLKYQQTRCTSLKNTHVSKWGTAKMEVVPLAP